jgi:hypothetical protein
VLPQLQSALPTNVGSNSPVNIGGNLTGLVSYPAMLRALGLSRYVGDRLRREGRFRTVEAGRNIFVPAADVERLRAHLAAQREAREARNAVADLPWFERARDHRLPIALGRTSAVRVLCGKHLHQRVVERVVDLAEITWVASLALRIRFARSGEICADCAQKVPIHDHSPRALGGIDVAELKGDRSRGVCVAHWLDALSQAAHEVVRGRDGKYISVRGVIEIFERLYVGNGYEFCSVCMTDAAEAPIRKRISSPVHQFDFISRHPARIAAPTLRALS